MARTDRDKEQQGGRELQRSESDGPIKLSLAASTAAVTDSKSSSGRAAPQAAAPLFGDDEGGLAWFSC